MEIKEIVPGCKVDISIVQLMGRQDDVKAENATFASSVYDVNDDDTIELYMPTEGGRYQLLPKNIRYEFSFSIDSQLYNLEGTVSEHLKRGNIYLVKVVPTSGMKKVQRREYFRIECLIPMMFSALDEEAATQVTMEDVKAYMNAFNDMRVRGIGTILDISGGGARLVSTNSLRDISFILMQFTIEQGDEKIDIEVIGKVVNSEKMPDDNKYIHRLRFFFKDERTQEKIISYVFEEERKLRKKEQGV